MAATAQDDRHSVVAAMHNALPPQSYAQTPDHGSPQGAAAAAIAVQGFAVDGVGSAAQADLGEPVSERASTPRSNPSTQRISARKVLPKSSGRQARQPFGAHLLLAQHGDLDFGVHELAEMHLSQRQLQPGKYYTMLDVIDM